MTNPNSSFPASEAIWIQKPGGSVLPRVGRFVGAEFPVRSMSVNSDGMPMDFTPPQTPPTATNTLIAEQFMNGPSFVGDRRRRTLTISSFDTNNNSLFGDSAGGPQFSPPSPKLPLPPEAVGTVSSSVPHLFRRSNSISVTNPSSNTALFNRMNGQMGPISGSPNSSDILSDVFKRSIGQFFSSANGGTPATTAANHHHQQQPQQPPHSSTFNRSESIPTGTSHTQANQKSTSAHDFTLLNSNNSFASSSPPTNAPTILPFSNQNRKMTDKTNSNGGESTIAAKQNRKVLTDRVVSLLCENAIR